jgi:vacuolar-type H+-ATPase subunit H
MVEPSPREPESMDIMYLLERLEEVLGAGTRLPFSSRALVDDEECFEIIDQIRLSLPNEIRQARKVNADRDAVIDQARTRAEQIIKGAESEAYELVQNHHIAREAEAQREEIIAQAERRAAQVRREVDDYAYQVLLDLDKRLAGLAGTVRNGLRSLQPEVEAEVSAERESEAEGATER